MTAEKKVALVTGATRGIGASIAARLAADGFCVIGTATTQAGADTISAALSSQGGQGMVLDVCDPECVTTLLAAVTAQFGVPLVLVNNAAVTQDGILMKMNEDSWSQVINTNLTAVYRLSQACLKPMMKARFGRVINITSVVAFTGNPGQANYTAAKAGVIGFSKTMSLEGAPFGITVNCVAPGYIDTDMTQAMPEKRQKQMRERIPMRKAGSVDDIAAAVSYIASDEAAYMTGQTLHINGGLHLA